MIETINPRIMYRQGVVTDFHEPGKRIKVLIQTQNLGKNYTTENYIVTPDTMNFMADHLKKYGNQVDLFLKNK